MNLAELNEEGIRETAMVDIAYHILNEKGEPLLYREIMKEIGRMRGFSEEESQRLIAQLYTEINIDGRFICVGKSLWGLKRWYPLDQTTDSAFAQNVKEDVDEVEEDLFEEEDSEGEEDLDGDFDEDDEKTSLVKTEAS